MMIKKWQILVIFIQVLVALVLYVAYNIPIIFLITLTLVMVFATILIGNLNKNSYIIAFVISFFVFVIGSTLIELITKETNVYGNESAANHTFLCQLISIVGLIVGTLLGKRLRIGTNREMEYAESERNEIRKTALILFYISFAFAVIDLAYTIVFVFRFGYVATYMSLYAVPSVIESLADTMPLFLFAYLATFPCKNEAKKPMLLYFGFAVMHILSGKRFLTVSAIIILVVYMLSRNDYEKEDVWISKKTLYSLIGVAPLIMIGLYYYSFIRVGTKVDTSLYSNGLVGFLSRAGAGAKVIAYEYTYADRLPEDKIYSFGKLIEYFQNGLRVLSGNSIIRPAHTADYAINGNIMSYALTYAVVPNRYLNGYGLGSCYIAELYHDFGYIGIFAGNLILGITISKLSKIDEASARKNFILLFLLYSLLRMPRDTFCLPITEVLNVKNIFSVMILLLLSKIRIKNSNLLP